MWRRESGRGACLDWRRRDVRGRWGVRRMPCLLVLESNGTANGRGMGRQSGRVERTRFGTRF